MGSATTYRNLAFFVGFPLIILCASNIYVTKQNEEYVRPPFIKYEYLRKRDKRFPWAEGDKKSLFHNPHRNPTPDGYEDELEENNPPE